MLKFLRRAVKSWVAKALIALLVASFAVWGIGDIFSFRLDSSVAEVGDTAVSAERFADALQREQTMLSQRAGELVGFPVLRQLGIDRRVLAGLIRDAAYAEELTVLGIAAPDDAVAEAIRSDPAFQGPAGEFSDAAYRGLLARQGLSPSEFEALTRQLLAQSILTGTVGAAPGALPGAAVRVAAWRGETRDVAQLLLTPEMAGDPEAPAEEDLRAFYEARPDRYTEPERRWGRYLHVDVARLAETLEPDEETLRQAYEAEKDRFTTPPTRTVERIPMKDEDAANAALARINSGEIDFDALVEERGLSVADVQLGTVRPDDLPPMTAEPVFAAKETGVIGPVPTPLGSSIVRITKLTEGGAQPFEEVRDELAARMASDAALQRAPELANRIEEERAAGKSLEEIAKAVGLPLGTFEGLARDGTLADGGEVAGFAASNTFQAEAFQALDLEERDIVETPEGGFLLVMVDRIEESALRPFEDVRERVEADYEVEARLIRLESRAAELAKRLEKGETVDELAAELDIPASRLNEVGRFDDSPNLPASLVGRVFEAEEGGTAIGRAPDGEGVILAQVTGINPVPPEDLAESSGEIEAVLEQSIERDLVEYFGRAIEARHGASVDPSVLEEVHRLLQGRG